TYLLNSAIILWYQNETFEINGSVKIISWLKANFDKYFDESTDAELLEYKAYIDLCDRLESM
ncbi:MAG TPA: hypothetical protein DIU05_00555, partial [Bacteroidetes bacterium]|nr:hypothetical protein [Bacteroidota bacterium]